MSNNVNNLAALLDQIKPILRISPGEVSRSIIHDVSYRVAVIFLVFDILGKQKIGGLEINANLLWFSQFIVARADLLPEFLQWALKEKRGEGYGSLFGWPLMPKGYLNDNEHVRLISVLIATKSLEFLESDVVVLKQDVDLTLKDLQVYVRQPETFKREKLVLQNLKEAGINLKLLGFN